MTNSDQQGRCCPSPSAPTPCRGRAGKIGNGVVALRRRFRTALRFTSPLSFTRDAGSLVSTAVRRHLAMGVGRKGLESICGLCFRLGRVGGTPLAVGIGAYCRNCNN
jgi:hypothetical protein